MYSGREEIDQEWAFFGLYKALEALQSSDQELKARTGLSQRALRKLTRSLNYRRHHEAQNPSTAILSMQECIDGVRHIIEAYVDTSS